MSDVEVVCRGGDPPHRRPVFLARISRLDDVIGVGAISSPSSGGSYEHGVWKFKCPRCGADLRFKRSTLERAYVAALELPDQTLDIGVLSRLNP